MKKSFTILVTIGVLTAAAMMDNLFRKFQSMENGMQPVIPIGAEITVHIALAIALLGLALYVLLMSQRSLLVVFSLIIIGAFALFSMSLLGITFWGSLFVKSPQFFLWITQSAASHHAFTRNAAAMILVIGLARLLPAKCLERAK